jgi:hypothetical protein
MSAIVSTVPVAADRAALLLSGLCALHCLALPLLLPVLPWLAWWVERESAIHGWLLLAVVPLSAAALLRGLRRHRQPAALALGVMGLSVLMLPLLPTVPAAWEAALALTGSAALSSAHLLNLRALRSTRVTGNPILSV